jgi:hypothetical protein
MNPNLPDDYIERMREDDPEAYRSEVLGEFRRRDLDILRPRGPRGVLCRTPRDPAGRRCGLQRVRRALGRIT